MAPPTKAQAKARLQKVLDKISELKRQQGSSPEFTKWFRNTRIAIINAFGTKSDHVQDFDSISFSPLVISTATPDSEYQAAYVRGLDSAASVLESMLDEIEEYWEDTEKSPRTSTIEARIPKNADKVFVVHGHDESARETVARFLERLELQPVVLHERPNQGRTIIEKFEDHTDVAFAVILLTPDDVGGLKDQKTNFKPRARQNVILELGFFLGKLGRHRVCPLVKGDVETPSDYDGVVYTDLDDAGGWKMKLVQELKAAGFDVDANRVFQT